MLSVEQLHRRSFHLCYPWIAGLDTNPPQTTSSFGANEPMTHASRVILRAGSDHHRCGAQHQDLQTTVQHTVELERSAGDPFLVLHSTSQHQSTSQSLLRSRPCSGVFCLLLSNVLNQSARNRLRQVWISPSICLTGAKPNFSINKLELYPFSCCTHIFFLAKLKWQGSHFSPEELIFLSFPVQQVLQSIQVFGNALLADGLSISIRHDKFV